MPSTGNCFSSRAASVSAKPSSPKSSPWLLAIDTASTPAARRASSATAGVRKLYFFGTGVPRSVIAVSRLTIARSAALSVGAIGARTAAGSFSSFDRRWPSNITSPPNASVTA